MDNPQETKIKIDFFFYLGSSETTRYAPLLIKGWIYSPLFILTITIKWIFYYHYWLEDQILFSDLGIVSENLT